MTSNFGFSYVFLEPVKIKALKRGVEIITKLSRAARCALIGSTVSDLDQSADLEGTEICGAERSQSPEEKELAADKFICQMSSKISFS